MNTTADQLKQICIHMSAWGLPESGVVAISLNQPPFIALRGTEDFYAWLDTMDNITIHTRYGTREAHGRLSTGDLIEVTISAPQTKATSAAAELDAMLDAWLADIHHTPSTWDTPQAA